MENLFIYYLIFFIFFKTAGEIDAAKRLDDIQAQLDVFVIG